MLPSGRRHRFSTHAWHLFFYGVGIRKFFSGSSKRCFSSRIHTFCSRGSAFFYNNRNICFINTFTMCHSTRSRRRRRRKAATPATTPTTPTWMWRGRRRRTPSRPMRTPKWIRMRPNSRRGPPLLLSLGDCLAPWYATPFRLKFLSFLIDCSFS